MDRRTFFATLTALAGAVGLAPRVKTEPVGQRVDVLWGAPYHEHAALPSVFLRKHGGYSADPRPGWMFCCALPPDQLSRQPEGFATEAVLHVGRNWAVGQPAGDRFVRFIRRTWPEPFGCNLSLEQLETWGWREAGWDPRTRSLSFNRAWIFEEV